MGKGIYVIVSHFNNNLWICTILLLIWMSSELI